MLICTRRLHEDVPLDRPDLLQQGYIQSKWVAEQLVMQAGARGVPVTIFRPGRISGDSRTGAYNPQDMFGQILRGFVRMGSVPELDGALELTPVDYVSQAIVELAGRPEVLGRTFHLFNPHVLAFGELVGCMEELGYELRKVRPEQWREELIAEVARTQDETLSVLLRVFGEQDTPQEQAPREQPVAQQIDCQTTVEALAVAGIACPEIDAARLRIYFDYLTQIGWMPPALGAPTLVE